MTFKGAESGAVKLGREIARDKIDFFLAGQMNARAIP
jgi:hypothetical protein